jgi:hypothetical protein
MSRKRLARLIGKEVKYTATITGHVDVGGKTTCLQRIKHKGKNVADHVWILRGPFMQFNRGDKVEFTGKAYTYHDKYNKRKTGIITIGNVKRHLGEIHEEIHDSYRHIKKRLKHDK